MPSLAGLFARGPEGPLRIPVDAVVALGYAVYYVPGYPPLGGEDLRRQLPAWLDSHAEEPLRDAVKAFSGGPSLAYTDDLQRAAIPLPPHDLLRSEGAAEEDLKRLDRGYQLVVISARDVNQVPRLGLWAARAGALAAASALEGVAYDPARMALLTPSSGRLPGHGVIEVQDHVSIRVSSEPGTSGWVRTAGMSKFGLPDLRAGFPAGLEPPRRMLADCSQQLIDALLRANHGRQECVTELDFGPHLTANDLPLLLRYTPADNGGRGWLDVGVSPVAA